MFTAPKYIGKLFNKNYVCGMLCSLKRNHVGISTITSHTHIINIYNLINMNYTQYST